MVVPQKFYGELAEWWHLISPPTDYEEEAAFFLNQLKEVTLAQNPQACLLELGSGGGNNAFYMKHAFAQTTLVDLSSQMLAVSHRLNPDCQHIEGDMRTIRLNQLFDAVFIHDAIDYMTTLDDLTKALKTASLHCKVGGIALFAPDDTSETFEAETSCGGSEDSERGVRYLEWSHPPKEGTHIFTTDYVFILKEKDLPPKVEYETHTLGLFSQAEWLTVLESVGFSVSLIQDNYNRTLFVATKVY